jgi:protein-L-isoaspartate(D-aspartate) O-methyltransferase
MRKYTRYIAPLLLLFLIPQLAISTGSTSPFPEPSPYTSSKSDVSLPELIQEFSEPFDDIKSADLEGLLRRIGNARVVLIGEASHGTREFYEMRARITRELIEKKGFNIIALEGDWPDVTIINSHVRNSDGTDDNSGIVYKSRAFDVFPEWMWRNDSVTAFTLWLQAYNSALNNEKDAISMYGLDLYNLSGSIDLVLDYLRDVNPKLAEFARWSYGCLGPWLDDPGDYGHALNTGRYRSCESDVFVVEEEFNRNRDFYAQLDEQRFFHVIQNLRLIRNGERYFRTLYTNSTKAWNQRDSNMMQTLQALLEYHGPKSRAVVWAHNIHIGDSRATDLYDEGKVNLGHLVREAYDDSYLIGFGTHRGTVSAAPHWYVPVEQMSVPPAHPESYEYLFHQVEADNFMLPLRDTLSEEVYTQLSSIRLERAIGVAYDPANELKKHYFPASLSRQFDEYIWFDKTHAVKPLQ